MNGDENSRAIVPYRVQPPAALLPTSDELSMIKAIAGTAIAGQSLLPKIGDRAMTAGEAAVIMLYGRELGVQPMAALSHIYVVKGRPETSTQLKVGLMQARDPDAGVEILERTTERAKVRVTYKGRSQVFEATMEDAKRADLATGVNWKKYPKQMLVWTATRTGVRIMAPDAILALAQLPAIDQTAQMLPDDDPSIIEGEAVDVTDLPPIEPTLTEEGEADIEPPPVPISPPTTLEPEEEPIAEPVAVEEPPAEDEADLEQLQKQAHNAVADYKKAHGVPAFAKLLRSVPGAVNEQGNWHAKGITADVARAVIAACLEPVAVAEEA